MSTTIEFLTTVPVLADLEAGDLGRLAELLHSRHLQAEEVIIREGDPAEEMYFVVSGVLNVSEKVVDDVAQPDEQLGAPLHALNKGDLFGEMAFFDGRPRSAAVYAATPAVVLALSYKDLDKLIHFDGSLASKLFFAMMRNICIRLRETNDGVKLLYQRLIKYDTGFQSILRTYSEDDDLRHLFRRLVY